MEVVGKKSFVFSVDESRRLSDEEIASSIGDINDVLRVKMRENQWKEIMSIKEAERFHTTPTSVIVNEDRVDFI